jgi:uncharacterized membrane protein YgcG
MDMPGRLQRKPRTLAMVLALAALGGAMPALWAAPAAQEDADAPRLARTEQQMEQLVAPIAMYPDTVVAQILAAATFPDQVVQARRWLQSHPGLAGADLAQSVDALSWDASVKALTAFPAVLENMDQNLSWTSTLGDAYFNQPEDVMDAIQALRRRAQDAGNLKSTPQQSVGVLDDTVTIQPSDTQVVYLPAYDPWIVYGEPLVPWPEWYPCPGIWYNGPYLSFGLGIRIGAWPRFPWGWGHWGCDWHGRQLLFNNARYRTTSTTFYNRTAYYRGNPVERGLAARAAFADNPGAARGYGEPRVQGAHGYGEARPQGARGYAEPRPQPQARAEAGVRGGAFGNYGHGGEARANASRGNASLGSGGGHASGGGSQGSGGGGSHGSHK